MKDDIKPKEYKIIRGLVDTVEYEINKHLQLDWVLFGKPMIITTTTGSVDIFLQPMVKYDNKKKNNND